MVKFTASLIAKMTEELSEISSQSGNTLQKAERSYQYVQRAIQNLKIFILDYSFRDQAEEIKFFKEIKPQFLSELIYYKELYYIESGKPFADQEVIISYYRQHIDRIRMFFERNQDLYNYYLMDKTHNDERYFIRTSFEEDFISESIAEFDTRFCTLHSYNLSKIFALENVYTFVNQSISQIENPELGATNSGDKRFRNKWTGTNTGIIELGFALWASGAVNDGKGGYGQVIEALAMVFNCKIGNYHRTLQNMSIRKKDMTPLLHSCIEAYNRKILK